MKIVIFVVLLGVLQNTVVSVRNFDDITADFHNYTLDFHNTLAKESAFLVSMEDGKELMSEYERNIIQIRYNFEYKFSLVYGSIQNAVRQIILETGMSDHPDLVEHCKNTIDSDYDKMYAIAWANEKVCYQIGTEGMAQLQAILKEISDRKFPIHAKWQQVIPDCASSTATNSQLVSCLVENVHGKMGPELAQLMKQMRDDVASMGTTVTEKLNDTQTCFTIISNDSDERLNISINGFRDCCVAASPGAH